MRAVTAVTAWTSADGELGQLELGPTRFGRMLARVLTDVGVAAGDGSHWIVGTTRGPWRARIEHAASRRDDAPPTIAGEIDRVRAAWGHEGAATWVGAGTGTVAMALVEAWTRAPEADLTVLWAEEETPEHDASAVAWVSSSRRPAIARMTAPVRIEHDGPLSVPAAFTHSPIAAALALVAHVRGERRGACVLEPGAGADGRRWVVTIDAVP